MSNTESTAPVDEQKPDAETTCDGKCDSCTCEGTPGVELTPSADSASEPAAVPTEEQKLAASKAALVQNVRKGLQNGHRLITQKYGALCLALAAVDKIDLRPEKGNNFADLGVYNGVHFCIWTRPEDITLERLHTFMTTARTQLTPTFEAIAFDKLSPEYLAYLERVRVIGEHAATEIAYLNNEVIKAHGLTEEDVR